MKHLALPLAFASAWVVANPAAATVTTLTTLPSYFNWSYFGGALYIAQIHGVNFVTPAGATGPIQTISAPVYAIDTGPRDHDSSMICTGGVRCEQIGAMQFQYALWKGVAGRGYTPNTQGAVVFGGFQLTDSTDTAGGFSFLQTYQDGYFPNGTVDGGWFNGKVNSQIPGFQSNPNFVGGGWNYAANSPQYQFFDVPFDFNPGTPPETVSFQTALANTNPITGAVNILSNFSWSFSTLNGQLTGQPVVYASAPSSTLLSVYRATFPGVAYTNGMVAPTGAVPEPASWITMLLGVFALGGMVRMKRPLANPITRTRLSER